MLRPACFALILAACVEPRPTPPRPVPTVAPSAAPRPVTISIVGTNDLHGRVLALPILGGYLDNLRRVRAADGGGVLLVDAGDMFQGTLESNLLEGAPVRDAYAALGYAAVTVGNHEFDFGPAGPKSTPRAPGDDPRGALAALARGAAFPFLSANVKDRATGRNLAMENLRPSTTVVVAGVPIGLVGVTTEKTLEATIASNVSDLAMEPAASAIVREADALRRGGVRAVVVLAHAGSHCATFTNDVVADKCDTDDEIFRLARELPPGTVDVIVAGHTHAAVAHEAAGIGIIEQYAYGRAFGRVDLTFATSGPPARHVFAPRELCPGQPKPDFASCEPGDYEGAPVARAPAVQAAIAAGVEVARERRAAAVGVTLTDVVKRDYKAESALGNLFADLILAGAPGADVALMNGGGLREDLPAGELRYGALFESFPFDNMMATARVRAADLERILADHLAASEGGILSIAGLRVRARCVAGALHVELSRKNGKRLAADDVLLLAASDFMLLGGDAFWGSVTPPPFELGDELMRDVFERGLARMKKLSPSDVYDAHKPRLDIGARPLRCSNP